MDELASRNYISKSQFKILNYIKRAGLTKEQDSYIEKNSTFLVNINILRGDLLFFEDNEDKIKSTISRLNDTWYYFSYYDAERHKKCLLHKRILYNYDFDSTYLFTEMSNVKEYGYNNFRF